MRPPCPAPPPPQDAAATAPLANPATAQELPQVLIIGTAPLRELGQPLSEVPANVQTATSTDLKRQQSLGIADYLNNNFSGVSVNESQDNPFQADVNYHGFTASPLLGTPQGLSVYVDGVRVNEAFGDTVNWDLIPESAISTISLMSGSNPTFGLNTLGGALSVQTKSGHDYPGTSLEGYGGSFGRYAFEGETGGASGPFDYFLSGNYFDEDGWRNLSPSKVKQLFGKVGWETDRTDLDLSYTWADTQLTGNGPVPESMLAYQRESIYTAPDFTHNTLNFVNATGTYFLDKQLLLSGNLYYRHLRTRTLNGDANDDNYLSEDYGGPAIDCTAAPAEPCRMSPTVRTASIAHRRSRRRRSAPACSSTATNDLFRLKNHFVLGASYDHSDDDYGQAFQYASLTPLRQTVAIDDPNNPNQTRHFRRAARAGPSACTSPTRSPPMRCCTSRPRRATTASRRRSTATVSTRTSATLVTASTSRARSPATTPTRASTRRLASRSPRPRR